MDNVPTINHRISARQIFSKADSITKGTWKEMLDSLINTSIRMNWTLKFNQNVLEKLKACRNGKCLATKHHQTLFYRLATLFGAVWSCLIW